MRVLEWKAVSQRLKSEHVGENRHLLWRWAGHTKYIQNKSENCDDRGGENCQQSRIKAQLWITSLPVFSLKWPHGDTPVGHHAVMMMPLFNFTFCICQIATPCFIIHEEEGPRTQGGLRDWSLQTLLFKGFNNETLKKTRNSQQCWSYCVISNVSVVNLHSFNVQRGRCLWL